MLRDEEQSTIMHGSLNIRNQFNDFFILPVSRTHPIVSLLPQFQQRTQEFAFVELVGKDTSTRQRVTISLPPSMLSFQRMANYFPDDSQLQTLVSFEKKDQY